MNFVTLHTVRGELECVPPFGRRVMLDMFRLTVRKQAVQSLLSLGLPTSQFSTELKGCLVDEDWVVQHACLEGLQRVAQRAVSKSEMAPLLPSIAMCLKHEESMVVLGVLPVLDEFKESEFLSAYLPDLERVLQDRKDNLTICGWIKSFFPNL